MNKIHCMLLMLMSTSGSAQEEQNLWFDLMSSGTREMLEVQALASYPQLFDADHALGNLTNYHSLNEFERRRELANYNAAIQDFIAAFQEIGQAAKGYYIGGDYSLSGYDFDRQGFKFTDFYRGVGGGSRIEIGSNFAPGAWNFSPGTLFIRGNLLYPAQESSPAVRYTFDWHPVNLYLRDSPENAEQFLEDMGRRPYGYLVGVLKQISLSSDNSQRSVLDFEFGVQCLLLSGKNYYRMIGAQGDLGDIEPCRALAADLARVEGAVRRLDASVNAAVRSKLPELPR